MIFRNEGQLMQVGKCYRIGRRKPLVVMRYTVTFKGRKQLVRVEGYSPLQYATYEEYFLKIVDDGTYRTKAQIKGLDPVPMTVLKFKSIPKVVEVTEPDTPM